MLKWNKIAKSPLYNGLFLKFWGWGLFIFLGFQISRIATIFLIDTPIHFEEFIRIIDGSLKMDISATSYLLSYILTLFGVLTLQILKKFKILIRIISILNVSIILIVLISLIVDIFLLKYWGCRINAQALSFIKFPVESVKASISKTTLFLLLFSLLIIGVICYWFMTQFITYIQKQIKKSQSLVLNLGYLIPTLFLLFLGIRGGTSKVPLQISESFRFQKNNELNNQLSLNSFWNFIYQFSNLEKHPKIDHITSIQFSSPHFESDYFGKSSQEQQFEKQNHTSKQNAIQPNIYLFILEGVSAEISNYFSQSSVNATPNLDNLAKNGLGFKQAFACGDRTDKGLATILSAWPGQPWQSILNYPDKYKKLPSLIHSFKQTGYQSHFYYGGNLNFANMQNYLLNAGLDSIYDENELDNMNLDDLNNPYSVTNTILKHLNAKNHSQNIGKAVINQDNEWISRNMKGNWGYFDPILLDVFQVNTTKKIKQHNPKFNIVLTSSTHEPYDINKWQTKPLSRFNNNNNRELQQYIHSVRILDLAIYQCIKRIQRLDTNALFVIISDHGKNINTESTFFGQRNFFHIPWVFWGKPIDQFLKTITMDERNKLISNTVSQVDLANSLNYLVFNSLKKEEFPFSRNALDLNHPGLALFNMYGVMGIIERDATNWLSTDKKSIEMERPWNTKDSTILYLGRKIILNFFEL